MWRLLTSICGFLKLMIKKIFNFTKSIIHKINSWLGGCCFFAQTTIHPLGQIGPENPPGVNLAWVLISAMTVAFSGWQIRGDVLKMVRTPFSMNVEFIHEAEYVYVPQIAVCYHHWSLWVDWHKAYRVLNLTKLELITLMAPFNNDMHADQCPTKKLHTILERALQKIMPGYNGGLFYLNMSTVVEALQFRNDGFSIMPSRYHDHLTLCENEKMLGKRIRLGFPVNTEEILNHSLLSTEEIKIIEHQLHRTGFYDIWLHDKQLHHIAINSASVRQIVCSFSYDMDMCQLGEKPILKIHQNDIKKIIFKEIYFPGNIWNNTVQILFEWGQRMNYYNYIAAESHLTCGNISNWHAQFGSMDENEKMTWREEDRPSRIIYCPRINVEIIADEQVWFRHGPKPSNRSLVLLKSRNGSWPFVHYEDAFSISQLISNIGGTLGVWTGASLISVCHLIMCFVGWLRKRVTIFCRANRNSVATASDDAK